MNRALFFAAMWISDHWFYSADMYRHGIMVNRNMRLANYYRLRGLIAHDRVLTGRCEGVNELLAHSA